MAALPVPEPGGSLEELRGLINITASDWPLVIGWELGSFNPRGPYPVLILKGEQGVAKTAGGRVVRSTIDPSAVPQRSCPRNEHDLVITASHSWIMALDNVSQMKDWLSDAICRLSTGGGFATRELYSDNEEVLFAATRPVMLNGIDDIATRSDLLDRAIIITLPRIPDDKRKTEVELWAMVEHARPGILGVFLDAVSLALKEVDHVILPALPRMADFAKWVVAGAPALGIEASDFLNAYAGNRHNVHELALGSSPVAVGIMALMEALPEGGEWSGTSAELLEKLSTRTSEAVQRSQDWPKDARSLSSTLTRLAPNLRALGIGIERARTGVKRHVTIRKGKQNTVISVISVTTDTKVSDAKMTPPTVCVTGCVTGSQIQNDANDGNDAKIPTLSNVPGGTPSTAVPVDWMQCWNLYRQLDPNPTDDERHQLRGMCRKDPELLLEAIEAAIEQKAEEPSQHVKAYFEGKSTADVVEV
jgi:hypothetical protein